MIGHHALKSGEQDARETVSRISFLWAVGIDIGDNAGRMADQCAGGHVGNVVQLFNGVEYLLNRLRGNALVVAVDDV